MEELKFIYVITFSYDDEWRIHKTVFKDYDTAKVVAENMKGAPFCCGDVVIEKMLLI